MKTEVYPPIYRVVCAYKGSPLAAKGRVGWASYDAAKADFLEEVGRDIDNYPAKIIGKPVYDFN